jgi:polysaccharide biosynthesis protein PslG
MANILQQARKRPVIVAVLVAVVLLVGLMLDLRFKGLIWRMFYSVTGEESPVGQLVGFVGYLGNLTRRQPVTANDIPVSPNVDNPMGVNTFLDQEVELSKRERSAQMIAEAGFGWIRQQFRWDDIEIAGRGDFTDARNDLNGDGQPDAISAWDKYDSIVELSERYNMSIIARLGNAPAWSRTESPTPAIDTPPNDLQDFVNYAAAVAERYKGRIRYYQIWNEPNLSIEWGNTPVDPERYTEMLCRTYRALKTIDPEIIVISGSLAPTIDISGYNLNDMAYLQRMYNAGVAECFDVMGAQAYGLFSGPTDRRMRNTSVNFAHVVWLRDMMVANNDARKPIWITEMAWNPVPDSPDVRDRLNFGIVSDDQAARYAVEAYRRAESDWQFVGVVCYWFFKRPSDAEINQSWYYFRLVDPDFTPRPVYDALKDYGEQFRQAQDQ